MSDSPEFRQEGESTMRARGGMHLAHSVPIVCTCVMYLCLVFVDVCTFFIIVYFYVADKSMTSMQSMNLEYWPR